MEFGCHHGGIVDGPLVVIMLSPAMQLGSGRDARLRFGWDARCRRNAQIKFDIACRESEGGCFSKGKNNEGREET
jgi:hypothetical protein